VAGGWLGGGGGGAIRAASLLALLLALAAPARAQAGPDSLAAPPDTAATPPDAAAAVPGAPARGAAPRAEDAVVRRGPTPGGALRRALVLPGWGQVYAGQPAKTPFVVAAVAGLGATAVVLNGRYVRYRHAYLYVSRETADPATPDPGNAFAHFYGAWVETGSRPAEATRTLRDRTRRNRDLAVLGTAVAYALQALDAYVAAHLADFDVGEDLSLHARPTPDGAVVALRVRL
jgi:hypothetical protein